MLIAIGLALALTSGAVAGYKFLVRQYCECDSILLRPWWKEDPHKTPPARFLSGVTSDGIRQALGTREYECAVATGSEARVGRQAHCLRTWPTREAATLTAYGAGQRHIDIVAATLTDARAESDQLRDWIDSTTGLLDEGIRADAKAFLLEAYEPATTEKSTRLGSAAVRTRAVRKGANFAMEFRAAGGPADDVYEEDAGGEPFLTPLAIAAKFAPILRFSQHERFFPLSAPAYLRRVALCRFWETGGRFNLKLHRQKNKCPRAPSWRKLAATPLRCGQQRRCFFALDISGLSESASVDAYAEREERMRLRLAQKYTVYWSVMEIDRARLTVEYWFFYSFNAFGNRHEGDWEMIAVEVTRRGANAKRVAYSSHHSGRIRDWPTLEQGRHRIGTHPIVYVAYGSHANYFARDRYNVREDFGPTTIRACDRTTPAPPPPELTELDPSSYELILLEEPAFLGRWGPGNFVQGGRRYAQRGIEDPRRSGNWRFPEAFLENARADRTSPCVQRAARQQR